MNLNNPQAAKLYATMPEHRRTVRITKAFIRKALRQVERPYLACSFGKDSSVMLHLVLEQLPDVPVRFICWKNETELLNNFNEIIEWWMDEYGINLEMIELHRHSLDQKVEERKTIRTDEYDSYFIGFRADESKARRITIRKDGMIYKMKSGLVRIAPMAWWSVEDIAAYLAANDIPSLGSYQVHGFESRTASRVPRSDNGIRSLSLSQLKQRDMSAFNRLKQYYPEVSQYA